MGAALQMKWARVNIGDWYNHSSEHVDSWLSEHFKSGTFTLLWCKYRCWTVYNQSLSLWVCFAFVLCLFQLSYHTFPHCFLTSFHLHYFSFSIFSCSISFSTSWLYYFQPVPTSLPRSCMALLSSHFPHLLTSCFLRFFPPWIYYPWPCFLSSSSPPSSTIFCLPPLLSPTAAFKFDSITFQFHFPSSCSRLSVVPSYSFQGQSERIGMESDIEREKMKREENGH